MQISKKGFAFYMGKKIRQASNRNLPYANQGELSNYFTISPFLSTSTGSPNPNSFSLSN